MKRVLFVALFALLEASALACRSLVEPPNIPDAFHRADAVFYGKIVKVEEKPSFTALDFQVLHQWKGAPTKKFSVAGSNDRCETLGKGVAPGQTYLIFARQYDGQWVTGLLAGSRGISGTADLPRLKSQLDALARE